MATPLIISGLMNKRALLQAELEFHERKIALCEIMLAHFDATLALYEETKDAKVLRRRYLSNRKSRLFEHGLISNLVMGALRGAPKPLSTSEIFEGVIGGFETSPTPGASSLLYRNVRSAIANKVRQGIFRAHRGHGRIVTYEMIR
jgi:hypothetical protein